MSKKQSIGSNNKADGCGIDFVCGDAFYPGTENLAKEDEIHPATVHQDDTHNAQVGAANPDEMGGGKHSYSRGDKVNFPHKKNPRNTLTSKDVFEPSDHCHKVMQNPPSQNDRTIALAELYGIVMAHKYELDWEHVQHLFGMLGYRSR